MTATRLPTLEELQEQHEAMRARLEETEAALAQSDLDEQTFADLEDKFNEELQAVAKLSAQIDRAVKREDAIAMVPREKDSEGDNGRRPRIQINEPLTYRPHNKGGQHSFFKDLWLATVKGNPGAQSRLARHEREMEHLNGDFRADITAGSGDFVPPQHLQDEWIALARAGRVFANQVRTLPMPPVGTSFTIPKVTGGTSTAVQATEAAAASETDATRNDVTLTVRTIAGQQDMSRQAFERSEPGLDEVLFGDLAASYAVTLDAHLINHANDGVLNNANINAVTYTDTTPTVAELYPKLADAWQQVGTGRFMAANAVFMHTRRWAWLMAALDGSNRPLIVPVAPQNPLAGFEANVAEGVVGTSVFGTVYADPNIPTTLGGGTEDAIIVTRPQDHLLFESGSPVARVYEEVLSGTLQVRIQVYGYIAYTSDRYGAATSAITGSGLAAPTF